MVKKVVWSNLAHKNRIDILEYWINRNKSNTYSRKLNNIFEETAKIIQDNPKIGVKTEISGIRYKIIKDYLFTYRESDEFIEVLTIWDSRQDPDKFERIISK